jgi:hypothetical protein
MTTTADVSPLDDDDDAPPAIIVVVLSPPSQSWELPELPDKYSRT